MSSDPNPAPPTASLWRRVRFPLIMLAFCAAVMSSPVVIYWLDISSEAAMPVFMLMQAALVGSTVLLALWWLFFADFRWPTRAIGVLIVALLVAGFWLSIDKGELTTARIGGLVPKLRFVWEKSPAQELAEHLREQPSKSDDLPAIDATVGAEDFAAYRGPRTDGVVAKVKLHADWKEHPPKVVWKHPSVEGYSGIAVAGNIAVTLDHRDGKEAVVCFDRATGRQRWAFSWEGTYRDAMGDGPRSTPTIHDNRIFAVGAAGKLVCLTPEGKEIWSKNILEDAKAKNVKWGLTGSPLIVDDLVVVHAGIDPEAPVERALIAYDQATGKEAWAKSKRRASYSSPQLATIAGRRQILLFAGDGLVGCDAKTGDELWFFPWLTKFDMNMIQPIVLEDGRVFISSEAENGCAMLQVKAPASDAEAWSVAPLWKSRTLGARFANPVSDGKYIWGLHGMDGVLTCLDVKTGERQWRGERFGPGQLLLTAGQLLIVNSDGIVILADADASAYTERGRFAAFNKKTWNTPALAGDLLFLRNQTEIACMRLSSAAP